MEARVGQPCPKCKKFLSFQMLGNPYQCPKCKTKIKVIVFDTPFFILQKAK